MLTDHCKIKTIIILLKKIQIAVIWRLFLAGKAHSFYNTHFLQVNGHLWDLDRPLEADTNIEIIKFDHPEGNVSFFIIL